MTLNYWMMEERYPNLKEEAGGLIPGCEISSLLDIILARWSIASCALTLACWAFVSRKKERKEKKRKNTKVGDSGVGFHVVYIAHQILVKNVDST